MKCTENREVATHQGRRGRRRQYIISPAFQWKYAGMIMLGVFVASSLLGIGVYAILHRQARLRTMYPEIYQAEVSLVIFFSAVALAAVTAAGVGIWWIVVSHRLCGPLSIMGGWLSELGRGSFPQIRPLRRKDEFKDFYQILSNTINSLKARKEAELSRLQVVLAEAKSAVGSDERQLRTALECVIHKLESWCRDSPCTANLPPEASLAKATGTGPGGHPGDGQGGNRGADGAGTRRSRDTVPSFE